MRIKLAYQDGLQDAVTKLEKTVASAKSASDEAKTDFGRGEQVVQGVTMQILD